MNHVEIAQNAEHGHVTVVISHYVKGGVQHGRDINFFIKEETMKLLFALLFLAVSMGYSQEYFRSDTTTSASTAWFTDSIAIPNNCIVTVKNREATNGILMFATANDTTVGSHFLYLWPGEEKTLIINGSRWVRTKPVDGSVKKSVFIHH